MAKPGEFVLDRWREDIIRDIELGVTREDMSLKYGCALSTINYFIQKRLGRKVPRRQPIVRIYHREILEWHNEGLTDTEIAKQIEADCGRRPKAWNIKRYREDNGIGGNVDAHKLAFSAKWHAG